MPDQRSQNYANHVRFHPPFHFVLAPGGIVLLVLTIVNAVRNSGRLDSWILLLFAVLFFLAVFLLRVNPLKVQDRVIRLEERLRLQALLPKETCARIGDLSEAQLIALRFASDDELPGLVTKVFATNMKARDIKKAIVTWRTDAFRV